MRRIWFRIGIWWEWQQTVKAVRVADETIVTWGWIVGEKTVSIHNIPWKIWCRDERSKYTYLYRY